jgi:phosphoserine phosphatase RsbU/P
LRSLKGEVVKNEEELVRIPSSGELRYRQVSSSPVRDPSGNIVGSVSVVRDITDLKIAEIALRKSEEKFRSVFENSPLGIVTCDSGGNIIDINPAFVNMLGFTQDEIRTKSFLEFTHPDDITLESPLVEKLISGEINRYEIEKRYISKDGQVIWIRLIGSLIHGTDGIPLGIALVEDITERRQVEDHLRNQAEILSVITDAIIVVDTSFRIISWNARAEELYGWKEEQVLGKEAKDILRSELIGTDRTELYRRLGCGESVSTESVQRTKDDKQIFVKGYTVPLRDALGNITSYVAINHDITERKRAEGQMAFHALVLETLHDAVIATDAGFFITAWNNAAEQMYGWTEKEVVGKNSRDVMHSTLSNNDLEILLSDITTKGCAHIETTQHRKDGTPIIVEARLAGIRDDQGNIAYYVSANRDITGRRQVERSLHQAHMRTKTILEGITDTFYSLDN